jgi:hypothetical protein
MASEASLWQRIPGLERQLSLVLILSLRSSRLSSIGVAALWYIALVLAVPAHQQRESPRAALISVRAVQHGLRTKFLEGSVVAEYPIAHRRSIYACHGVAGTALPLLNDWRVSQLPLPGAQFTPVQLRRKQFGNALSPLELSVSHPVVLDTVQRKGVS